MSFSGATFIKIVMEGTPHESFTLSFDVLINACVRRLNVLDVWFRHREEYSELRFQL